jgi:hypothetical protein
MLSDACPVDSYYRDIESFKNESEGNESQWFVDVVSQYAFTVRKILHEYDFSIAGVVCDVGQRSHYPHWDGSQKNIGKSSLFGSKGILPQLSCDQRLDSTMFTLTTLTLSQVPAAQRAELETNTITVGCTNTTRCWSLYLRGLMELDEVKVSGDLMRLWKGQGEARENKTLFKARGFFEQALICVGSSVTDLKRKAQRSLALALGPTDRSSLLSVAASDLIHQSLNEATSRRLSNLCLDQCGLMSTKSIQVVNDVKAGLPNIFTFLAVVSCPTGEVLLDIVDRTRELKTCCLFPTDSEHVADSLLRPLHELLASSDKQLGECMTIDREDAEAKRRWRRDRRVMDESFLHFMTRASDLFASANLPSHCGDILFDYMRSACGNLSSRFDEVAMNENGKSLEDANPCMILLLDEKLQKFPFESLDFLESKPMCRLPSLLFAHEVWQRNTREGNLLNIHPNSVTYILNPEGDLSDTEERLLPALESVGTDHWTAYVNEKPQPGALEAALSQKNSLLMYFGHGGGERIISKDQLANLGSRPNGIQSSVILMGCSSGELQSPNQDQASFSPRSFHFEPDGLVLRYLLHGAPCIVGNLWDVTDRDIDIFTQTMLRSMFNGEMSIPESLTSARADCKFRYLTGASPVCYGLPASVRRSWSDR